MAMAVKERLYPNPDHESVMRSHNAYARFVWNLALEQRNFWSKDRYMPLPGLSGYDQKKDLTEARKHVPWLKAGPRSIMDEAILDLDQAFRNWWKNPAHFGRPTWRKAGLNEGFRLVGGGMSVRRLNRKWGEVRVPKCGWVRFRITRLWATIRDSKSARVTLDRQGRWHISFTAMQPEVTKTQSGSVIGIDMGVTHTVTTSNGRHLSPPALLLPHEKTRLRRLQRKHARQQPRSQNRERTRKQIASLKAKEAARRKAWIEETTTELVRDNDVICIENLNIRNMTKSAAGTIEKPGKNVAQKRGLNRSILAQGWGMFRTRLEQKAQAATTKTTVVAVNPAYTSRQCSACGHTCKANRKKQAAFACVTCGYTANADVNAAIVIRQRGTKTLAAMQTTAVTSGASAAQLSGTRNRGRATKPAPATPSKGVAGAVKSCQRSANQNTRQKPHGAQTTAATKRSGWKPRP